MLQLQRTAGNSAVARLLRAGLPGSAAIVQRVDPAAMPPKRPKVRSGSAPETRPHDLGRPMTMAEMYLAIQRLEPRTIRPEDIALLDNSQLRTLDSVLERTIARCRSFAEEQAADPAFVVPPPFPDVVYKNVVLELEQFRENQISARHPYHALRAIVQYHDLAGREVGSSAEAKALWKMSGERVREMLWRLELGSADPVSGAAPQSFFADDEVLRFGYVDRMVWDTISEDALVDGRTLPEERIVTAIRSQGTILPVVLANVLVGNAGRLDAEQLLVRLGAELDAIDLTIQRILTLINNRRVTGGLSVTYTHENVFWKWLWTDNATAGSVYSSYRAWAGE